jgi:hypothetical protein
MLWFAQGSASRQCRGRRRATAVGWRDRLESDPRRGRRALQKGDRASADALRWNLDLILDQRGADMADLPGGESGLLVRGYKGKETDRLVLRIDQAWSRWAPNSATTSGRLPRNWASPITPDRIAWPPHSRSSETTSDRRPDDDAATLSRWC